MIAHRRGRTITIAEDIRRPIRLVPRVKRAEAGDGVTVFVPLGAILSAHKASG